MPVALLYFPRKVSEFRFCGNQGTAINLRDLLDELGPKLLEIQTTKDHYSVLPEQSLNLQRLQDASSNTHMVVSLGEVSELPTKPFSTSIVFAGFAITVATPVAERFDLLLD